MKRVVLVCVLQLTTLAPVIAHAFSDPAVFADPADGGGGGGRWFTGSAGDGYTCKVCHRGGHSTDVLISGLPLAGYAPGTSYEVTIAWPADMENVALEAEFTDSQGAGVGGLRLPPQDELLPPEFCLPAGAGVGAGMLNPVGSRTVISMSDCGARQLRLLFTAPGQDAGLLHFTGSVVTSNAQGDVEGDGVTDFARVLPSPSAPQPWASRIGAGCTLMPRAPRDGLGEAWVVGIGLACLARRRSRRR